MKKLSFRIKQTEEELINERKFLRYIKKDLKNETSAIIKLTYNDLIPQKTEEVKHLEKELRHLKKNLIPREKVVFS